MLYGVVLNLTALSGEKPKQVQDIGPLHDSLYHELLFIQDKIICKNTRLVLNSSLLPGSFVLLN